MIKSVISIFFNFQNYKKI